MLVRVLNGEKWMMNDEGGNYYVISKIYKLKKLHSNLNINH